MLESKVFGANFWLQSNMLFESIDLDPFNTKVILNLLYSSNYYIILAIAII